MKISIIGETAALVAILDFIYWAANKSPGLMIAWVLFGSLAIVDYMLGGISDKGICKSCGKKFRQFMIQRGYWYPTDEELMLEREKYKRETHQEIDAAVRQESMI